MARAGRAAEVAADLSNRRARPAAAGTARLSVVVPAYHEAATVGATVARIREELAPTVAGADLEVVVVDDGSADGTAEAARAGGADQVLAFDANQGKGAAVRAGVLASNGRTIAFTDADLAYAPAQMAELLAEVEAGWDVVVGNRYHPETTTVVAAGPLREVGSRAIHLATRAVLVGRFADTQCGLKAFRSDVARLLFGHAVIDGFAFDVELLHLVERYRLSYRELPVEVENSAVSTVHVVADAARLLADLGRIRRHARQGRYDLTATERSRWDTAAAVQAPPRDPAEAPDSER